MKKTIIYGFIAVFIAFQGCKKYDDNDIKAPKTEIKNENLLNFKSNDELLTYIKSLQNPSTRGNKNGNFIALDEVIATAENEILNCSDKSQELTVVNRYKDVLTYVDGQVRPIVPNSIYRHICNRDRMYQTGNVINKLIDDKYVVSTAAENINALRQINTVDAVKNDKKFKIAEYNADKLNRINDFIPCDPKVFIYAEVNPDKCDNDRQLLVDVRFHWVIYHRLDTDNWTYYSYYTPFVSYDAHGRQRNWVCKWSEYSTTYTIKNSYVWMVTSELIAFDDYQTTTRFIRKKFVFPDHTSGDMYRMTASMQVGSTLINEDPKKFYSKVGFYKYHFEFTSRGLAGTWATSECLAPGQEEPE